MVPLGMEDLQTLLSILNNRSEALRLVPMFNRLFAAAENKEEFAGIIRGRMIYDKFYMYSDDNRDYNLGFAHDLIIAQLRQAGY